MDHTSTGVKNWKLVKEEPYADCRVFKVLKKTFVHPDGRSGQFYVNDSNDWVQCAALVRDARGTLCTVLVNQFRFGVQKKSWEFPGGVVENGENPVEAAKRELAEETGYVGENAELVARYSPNPAIQSNSAFFVVIDNCRKSASLHWDENEEIETKIVPVSELDGMISRGEIYHSIAISSAYFLKRYIHKNALA